MTTRHTPTVSLTLKAERDPCPRNAMPDFSVVIRNEGEGVIKLCTYMLRYRLFAAMNAVDAQGKEYGLLPYHSARWVKFRSEHMKTLAPQHEITEEVHLSNNTEWGFVPTGSQPPIIPRSHIISSFPAGKVTFTTLIFERLAVYVGQDDIYDGAWKSRMIPDDIPGADKEDWSGLYLDEIEGKTTVTFV